MGRVSGAVTVGGACGVRTGARLRPLCPWSKAPDGLPGGACGVGVCHGAVTVGGACGVRTGARLRPLCPWSKAPDGLPGGACGVGVCHRPTV